MGCVSSKKKVCRTCQTPYSPVRRSYSVHAHDHRTVDHVRLIHNHVTEDKQNGTDHKCATEDKTLVQNRGVDKVKLASKEELAMWIIEAKSWSKTINEKIPKIVPKTSIRTPPGEPEKNNVWEMMEGLEDISPLRPVHHFRSVSFCVPCDPSLCCSIDEKETPRVKENVSASPKPLWLHLVDNDSNSNSDSNDTSIASEFEKVIATLRRSLEELPPANAFQLKPSCDEKPVEDCALEVSPEKNANKIVSPGRDKLIVYFTGLRGVRKTYEDCCEVRVILKGLGVKVDERDLAMDSGFKEELKELMGEGFSGGGLPRVFVGRRYIGGADEIRRLNEDGKLGKIVESCELVDHCGGGGGGNCKVCEVCGGARFVPCEKCSGSRKIYCDENELEDCEGECGFHRCPECNENGLIRCPICCD